MSLDITCIEFEGALQLMKLGKTPGLDGLPIECDRTFKDDLEPHFQELLRHCHHNRTIPASWKDARIVLIPKEGKVLKHPSAYRPISILNSDYKILATMLAISKYIGSCIDDDQTGFIQRRYVKHNIRKVMNAVFMAQQDMTPRVLLSLDV